MSPWSIDSGKLRFFSVTENTGTLLQKVRIFGAYKNIFEMLDFSL